MVALLSSRMSKHLLSLYDQITAGAKSHGGCVRLAKVSRRKGVRERERNKEGRGSC